MTHPTEKLNREFSWIDRYFRPLAAGFAGSFNLGDDAALLSVPKGYEQIVTADALVAGIHFFADDPPGLIAKKALRTNLSDLAAKGARPWLYNLCLALPKNTTEPWLVQFSQGLAEDQAAFKIHLLGGDTVSSPNQMNGQSGALMIAITAFGLVRTGGMIRRKGAKYGDEIWVSGTIGDAALGLEVILQEKNGAHANPFALASEHQRFLRNRYLLPEPRVALAQFMTEVSLLATQPLIHAGLDVSDGLLADFGHMARESGGDILININQIPLSQAAQSALASGKTDMARLITGGDDYELALAASAANHPILANLAAAHSDVKLTCIGRVTPPRDPTAPQCRLIAPDGCEISVAHSGFQHF
ncbi:MAG: thiamine-phosphate kinase [Alphaproteobacteria bacterium]|nr:thiamine-phosphate kinase [Alphaproteobacteria bacterium]